MTQEEYEKISAAISECKEKIEQAFNEHIEVLKDLREEE